MQAQEELQYILNDPNVRDIFFGSEIIKDLKSKNPIEATSYNNQKLYIIVDSIPTEPLQIVGEFQIVYIEWGTFTEMGPRNFPPPEALPLDVRKKFDNILDTQLGLDFRLKFSNLTAISLDWKIVGEHYTKRPAIVFYVIRKGVIPIGNDTFPEIINDIETDVREGFYEPAGTRNEDCCEYKNFVSSGCSIGIAGTTRAGTLGMFVKDSNGHIYLLTNDHVIRMENGCDDQNIICQPADIDHIKAFEEKLNTEKENLGSAYTDNLEIKLEEEINNLESRPSVADDWESKQIKTRIRSLKNDKNTCIKIRRLKEDLERAKEENTRLASFKRGLRSNYNLNGTDYGVDAAIALLEQNLRDIEPSCFAINDSKFKYQLKGVIEEFESIDRSEPIFKVGRTTGLTKGYIQEFASINSTCISFISHQQSKFHRVQMGEIKIPDKKTFPSVWLDRQIVVKAKKKLFIEEGDSGCIWFDQSGIIIALGHGTLDTSMGVFAIGSPINAVLGALNVVPHFE